MPVCPPSCSSTFEPRPFRRLRRIPRLTRPAIVAASTGFQSPAITFHCTAVKPSSLATRRTYGRRAPCGGRKYRTGAPSASSRAALHPANSSRIRAADCHASHGCVIVWLPIRCPPAAIDRTKLPTLPHKAANQKKRRPNLIPRQHLQQPLRSYIIRPVVVRQRNLVGVSSRHHHPAKQLRLRPKRSIGKRSSGRSNNGSRTRQMWMRSRLRPHRPRIIAAPQSKPAAPTGPAGPSHRSASP